VSDATRGAARRVPVLVALVCGAAAAVLTAVPAAAHNSLASSNPADGQQVPSVPAEVVLTFAEPAIALGTQVVVVGPTGEIQQGQPELFDATVRQPLRGGAPAGAYTVSWRVTSVDGHPTSGSFTFSAARTGGGGPETGTGAPYPRSGGGSSAAPLLLGAALLAAGVAVGAVVLVRRRQRLEGGNRSGTAAGRRPGLS
jgi:hypothetical protein